MGVPQILMIALMVMNPLVKAILYVRWRTGLHDFLGWLGGQLIIAILLWWGGFFSG